MKIILLLIFCLYGIVLLGQDNIGGQLVQRYNSNSAEGKEIEALSNGVFGYDMTIGGVYENKKYYEKQGYTISYKYKDTTIYIFITIFVALVIWLLYWLFTKKNFKTITK